MTQLIKTSNTSTLPAIPSDKLLYASCWDSVYDIMKSEALNGMHIHCSFRLDDEPVLLESLKRDLSKIGVVSIQFPDLGRITLK